MADLSYLNSRYVFTLTADLTAIPVGETPTGYRVDIQYQTPGKITTDPARYYEDWVSVLSQADFNAILPVLANPALVALAGTNPTQVAAADKTSIANAILAVRQAAPAPPAPLVKVGWYGLDAKVVSGSDWAIIRSDGVAEFNGRATLQSTDPDKGLLAVTAGGPVNLLKAMGHAGVQAAASPSHGLQQVLNRIQAGQQPDALVLLAATFDAAGIAQSWAPNRMKKQAAGFWKYDALTRSQFIAVGKVSFGTGANAPLTKVVYDFYRVRAK